MTEPEKTPLRASHSYELRLQLAIKSVQSEVSNVLCAITKWLESHKVEPATVSDLELVMAEALNNVVEHAYLYAEDGEIDILVTLRPVELKVLITDSGRKFDGPPEFREMDVENFSFEELPEGGFGWNLIRSLTDVIEFEHADKKNRLTLTRNLQDPAMAE